MTNHVRLDTITHADVKVAARYGAAYGDAVNQVLVFPTEFEQLQREYPILFRRDSQGSYYAVALLGFDLDENLYLDAADGAGDWDAHYVPAIRRRGPFVTALTGQAGTAGEASPPALHIDLDDPRVGHEDGEALFLRHGGHSPYLRHIGTVLDAISEGHGSTAPFFAALAEHGLIRPATLRIELDDGTNYVIDDIHMVATEPLAALGGTALESLHRSGILRAATMAAASIDTLDRLIARKNRRLGRA